MKLDIRGYDPEELLLDAAKGLERSDWERALLFYEAAARLGDLNGTARYHWGRLLLTKGRAEEAVRVARGMRARALREVANHYMLCQALFAARNFEECHEQCELLLKRLKTHYGAINHSFESLIELGRWEAAILYFEDHKDLHASKRAWALYCNACNQAGIDGMEPPEQWLGYIGRAQRSRSPGTI